MDTTMPVALLRGLLNPGEVARVLELGGPERWPDAPPDTARRPTLCPELAGMAYHVGLQDDHVCLFMHTGDRLETWAPVLHKKLIAAMRQPHGFADSEGGAGPAEGQGGEQGTGEGAEQGRWPVDDPDAVLHVRCVEIHSYSAGGHLLTPGHRDCGSALTMSVLLSDPGHFCGGEFVTYSEGLPVVHEVGQGDAVLFQSESLHNVLTVTKGIRQSLVLELWAEHKNSADRAA